MTTELQPRAAIEPLFMLTAQTTLVTSVSGASGLDHLIFAADSGTFEGERLRGRLLKSGGDWVTRATNRSRMDVRLVLETHDGTTILLRYTGRAHQSNDQVHIEVAGSFDAPAGDYDWLNDVQTFGLGTLVPEGVRYQFYRFK